MAPLSTNRIAWTYTDDTGNQYRVSAQKAITDQGTVGGVAAAPTVPILPYGIKMRRATLTDGAGHSRTVVIYDGTATAYEPTVTTNLNRLENSTPFTGEGTVIPERRPRRSVTTQST